LRSALHDKPSLRKYQTRCRICGIIFLNDPRNGSRSDIACPFGCQEADREARAKERSEAFLRSPAGKKWKAKVNQRRSCKAGDGGGDTAVDEGPDFDEKQKFLNNRQEINDFNNPKPDECGTTLSATDSSVDDAEAPDSVSQALHFEPTVIAEGHDGRPGTIYDGGSISDDRYDEIVNDPRNNAIIRYIRSVTSLIEGRHVAEREIRRLVAQKMRQHSMYFWGRFLYRFHARANDPP